MSPSPRRKAESLEDYETRLNEIPELLNQVASLAALLVVEADRAVSVAVEATHRLKGQTS